MWDNIANYPVKSTPWPVANKTAWSQVPQNYLLTFHSLATGPQGLRAFQGLDRAWPWARHRLRGFLLSSLMSVTPNHNTYRTKHLNGGFTQVQLSSPAAPAAGMPVSLLFLCLVCPAQMCLRPNGVVVNVVGEILESIRGRWLHCTGLGT